MASQLSVFVVKSYGTYFNDWLSDIPTGEEPNLVAVVNSMNYVNDIVPLDVTVVAQALFSYKKVLKSICGWSWLENYHQLEDRWHLGFGILKPLKFEMTNFHHSFSLVALSDLYNAFVPIMKVEERSSKRKLSSI